MDFYKDFAGYYDKWVFNDSQANTLTDFYSDYLCKIDKKTKIVYLGIATGRIAIEIMKKSSHDIIGIDNSPEMLEQCEKNFTHNNLEDKLTLFEQDILDLSIENSSNIYILPFRTLIHFLSKEDKKECLASVYKSMNEGEVFIFDLDIFDDVQAKKNDKEITVSYYDEENGDVLYNQFEFDFSNQIMNATV